MRRIFFKSFLLLLLSSTLGFAQSFKGHGHSMGGGVALGGILKRLVVPNALPIGKIGSFHGYEVWDFSDAKKAINGNNRVSFCYSATEFTQDLGIFDFSFGGEAAYIRPVGNCPKNLQAVAGEDLTFTLAYDVGKGRNSNPIGLTLSYGFDLSRFNNRLLRHFQVNNPHNRTPAQRFKRLNSHLLKYLATSSARNLTAFQKITLKLFFSMGSFGNKSIFSKSFFSKSEIDFLGKIRDVRLPSFNQAISNALFDIQKDVNFYSCASYAECEEVYVDFMIFSDALTSAMSDCHTVSISAGLFKSFSINLSSDFKYEIGFGYAVTATDKIYTSNLSTSALAVGEFARHRFTSHSQECKEAPTKSAGTFADLLILLGYGKN
jgi:hypothetical protein